MCVKGVPFIGVPFMGVPLYPELIFPAPQEGGGDAGCSKGSHRGAAQCGQGGQFMLAASDHAGPAWEHLD